MTEARQHVLAAVLAAGAAGAGERGRGGELTDDRTSREATISMDATERRTPRRPRTIPRPGGPLPDGDHLVVDLDDLEASWAAREGPANIRRRWRGVGVADALDVGWIAAHGGELDDDALLSLLMDLCSFSGGADLGAQVAALLPHYEARFPEAP